MDRGALTRLAPTHAVVLAAVDAGLGEETIAAALQVPVESVGPLVAVARAKLEHLGREDGSDPRP